MGPGELDCMGNGMLGPGNRSVEEVWMNLPEGQRESGQEGRRGQLQAMGRGLWGMVRGHLAVLWTAF